MKAKPIATRAAEAAVQSISPKIKKIILQVYLQVQQLFELFIFLQLLKAELHKILKISFFPQAHFL